MIENLFRPWVLARLLSGAATFVLCAYGLWVGARVLARWRDDASSRLQLTLERRAELAAAIVQIALGATTVNLALTVLTADRLTHSIRGAMCAYGVFDASRHGFAALGLSILIVVLAGWWLALHRADLTLRRPTLTRLKFALLLPLAPLVFADLYTTTRWFLDLDTQVVASCCSLGLDDALGAGSSGAGNRPPFGVAGFTACWVLTTIGLLLAATRNRSARWMKAIAGVASGLGFVPALATIVWFVAPHAYETPHHLCPFCLLHLDVAGIGWPLFGGLLLGFVSGGGLLVIQFAETRAEPGDLSGLGRLARSMSATAAIGWAIALVTGAAPIVRYLLVGGHLL